MERANENASIKKRRMNQTERAKENASAQKRRMTQTERVKEKASAKRRMDQMKRAEEKDGSNEKN